MNRLGTSVGDLLKNNPAKKFELIQLGKSGAGKTTRSLTASQFGPVLIRDYDGKIQGALRNIPEEIKKEVNLDHIDIINCRDWDYDTLLKQTKELVQLFKDGKSPYATIIEDTFTNLSDIAYRSVFTSEDKLFLSTVQQLWGRVGHKITDILQLLQSLPCNLIVNCHTEDNEMGLPIGPAGRGGVKHKLGQKMTDMQYVVFEQGKNKVRVRNSVMPPVNTSLDAKYIDEKGFAKVFGLSVFGDYAFKK